MRHPWRRFAFAAALLAAAGVLLFVGKTLDAGVVNSPHDFSATGPYSRTLGKGGACSSCHIPHNALDNVLWPRSLSGYRNRLYAWDGNPSSEKNFLQESTDIFRATTLQCYDCHDWHATTDFETPASTPEIGLGKAFYDARHYPQNILSGFKKSGLSSPTMYEDGFGSSSTYKIPGYFENNPPTSATYGASDNTPLDQAGGHFFKQDPTGSSGDSLKAGDKLACNLCHDPHAWNSDGNWQAFFRKNWPTNTVLLRLAGSKAMGSGQMANEGTKMTGPGTWTTAPRDNVASRDLCTACHGSTTQDPVNFRDMNPDFKDSLIVGLRTGPASLVEEHKSTSQVACTTCHRHNAISASCNSCHSYPVQDNSTAGKQMSPGHWAHVGKPGSGGTDNSMAYLCEICHFGYSSRHNGAGIGPGEPWGSGYPSSVSINFADNINPSNGNGPKYDNNSATGANYAQGVPSGAANGVCAGLYCHGDNPVLNLNWGGSHRAPKWDNTFSTCAGQCHKASASLAQGNHAVHLDNTNQPWGPGGISVFSPAGNCSEGTANTSCHAAYARNPASAHVNGKRNFSDGKDNLALTVVCNNCHSTSVIAISDNGAALNKSGAELGRTNWPDNNYDLPCLTCHNNATRATTQMGGGGNPAPDIEIYWRHSGHGDNTIDNTGTTNTTTQNVYQKLPVPCGYCHNAAARHFGTAGTSNRWRLLAVTGFDNASGGLDKFCAAQCHIGTGDTPGSWSLNKPNLPMDHFWNVAAGETRESGDTHATSANILWGVPPATQDNAAANKMPLDSDIRQGGGANFLCVTCHDPHGVGSAAAGLWGRTFAGSNPRIAVDNLHMLRYDYEETLCRRCHLTP